MAGPVFPSIQILREDVARRIAAGEVIDRPAAVVRELLDNAIDAGAAEISLFIEEGGNKTIRVVDNGNGMGREDLSLCILPHATSKIRIIEDLEHTTSLGFRGEALSSIAAVSRLEIASRRKDETGPANIITVEGGKLLREKPGPGNPGTAALVENLFYNMPARKKFLKRPQTEASLCRAVFLEKAAAFPEIGFKLYSDNVLKLFLPADASIGRIETIRGDGTICESFAGSGEGFSVEVIAAPPHVTERDRRLIHIYANTRRINEFTLVQAVTHGYAGYVPGGLFPFAFVYVRTDPAFIDFNIHPAKREARFRNLPEIRSLLVYTIKNHLALRHTTRPLEVFGSVRDEAPEQTFSWDSSPVSATDKVAGDDPAGKGNTIEAVTPGIPDEIPNKETTGDKTERIVFYGQVWKVFLLASRGHEFFLVDQHAAHERLLYDALCAKSPRAMPLLVPIPIDAEPDTGDLLERHSVLFSDHGFSLVKINDSKWEIRAVPEELAEAGAGELADMLAGIAKTPGDLVREIRSRIACRKAIKEGDMLDPVTALSLVRQALALHEPRCPHGRPVWLAFSREELYRRFQRTV